MNQELLSTCPACKKKLEVNNITSGDWTNYKCPEHGEFNLSSTLLIMVSRNPHGLRNIAEYLVNAEERREVICTYDVGLA
ncbi:hypothetical protein I6H07_07480 [Hafnia alvei]|uniref:hypothetical protein n=1 Tax=Hafnia alvei TaxID=569 RepID=UPI000FDADD8F|nr:hypothetical protein [Hafnia alvei]MBI0275677.1 hypothetical protein [Hafnia alvei]